MTIMNLEDLFKKLNPISTILVSGTVSILVVVASIWDVWFILSIELGTPETRGKLVLGAAIGVFLILIQVINHIMIKDLDKRTP
jgi:hypothetical protein